MANAIMKLGLILSATDKMSRVINSAADNVNRKFTAIDKSMKAVNKAANQMFVAGAVAAAGIYTAVQAAEDGAASERRLANVFKQMWGNNGAANAAGKAASAYAETLSLQIGVEDDLIRITQAKLATFSTVSNKVGMMSGVFDRATRAAYDMAAVGFGEASQNAVILGKALDSPLTMIKALRKQGTVNDRDILNIQNIYKTKGLLAAQKAILNAVERQVKDTGIATVKATDLMKTGFDKVVEAIGGAFLPSVDTAKNGVIGVIQPTLDWINNNHKLIQTIAKIAIGMLAMAAAIKIVSFGISVVKIAMIGYQLAMLAASKANLFLTGNIWLHNAAIKAVSIWTKAITAAQWLWNVALTANPIGVVVVAIGALIAGVIYAWKNFAKFRAVILTTWETIKGFGNILKEYVIDRIKGIIGGLGSMGKAIGLLFKGKFKAAFEEAKVGVKALSGYDAAMKAATKTKTLMGNVSAKYTTTLAKEREKETPKSTQAVNSVKTNNATYAKSNSSAVNYSPVINIASGSAADKEAFRKMLQDHKGDLVQLMMEIQNKKNRLSYTS